MASYDDTATLNGSIVRVDNGASEVPIKNWLVTLLASLSGYTEVNGTKNTGTGTPETQYTASLGRTIYGGTADIVTGEGTETHKGYTLDNLTWSGGLIGGNWVWYTDLSSDGLKLPANSEIFSGICDNYSPIRYNGVSGTTNTIALRSNGYLYVNNGSSETDPTGKVTIELDTPTDFTFTPITPTPETENVCNFWADEGNTELTYYKDGYGTTSVTIHKETPEGEPVVETAKLHRIIYGGEVDVISGSAKPKNLLKVTGEKTTYTDIEYTVNDNGQVFANGTATALRSFRVIKNGDPGFSFKKGVSYTLSGCPSGGSDQTYQLDLRITNSVGTFFMNAKDYGNGVTFTPTEDAVAFPIILVRSGQVCDNLTFNPQIEVNSSKTEYAPHFDPFTFPPISMETDEGENTLFATEGASAIIYRKETD